MEQNGHYAKLVRLQFSEASAEEARA